jgi:hypothetical protein
MAFGWRETSEATSGSVVVLRDPGLSM